VVDLTPEPPRLRRGVYLIIAGAVLLVVLFAASIAGSYILIISSVNSDRNARQQARVPACALALSAISRESGQQFKTDMALYRVTGCPAVLSAADR
jgi:hypothetical protein